MEQQNIAKYGLRYELSTYQTKYGVSRFNSSIAE